MALAVASLDEKRLLSYLFNTSRADAHNILERPVNDERLYSVLQMKVFLCQIVDLVGATEYCLGYWCEEKTLEGE
ncbi:unnamed protein product [Protopolystoma xenopodis]|uniref:Uncharacterized protein n=1 Tax=Protopolystoma xenopodis TaxID=117903 RepID=A0A3S5BCD8_9PLAT|nr:unnamed protein product [Protopolystoma xenopodis]